MRLLGIAAVTIKTFHCFVIGKEMYENARNRIPRVRAAHPTVALFETTISAAAIETARTDARLEVDTPHKREDTDSWQCMA